LRRVDFLNIERIFFENRGFYNYSFFERFMKNSMVRLNTQFGYLVFEKVVTDHFLALFFINKKMNIITINYLFYFVFYKSFDLVEIYAFIQLHIQIYYYFQINLNLYQMFIFLNNIKYLLSQLFSLRIIFNFYFQIKLFRFYHKILYPIQSLILPLNL
jgi:hypothetical protein